MDIWEQKSNKESRLVVLLAPKEERLFESCDFSERKEAPQEEKSSPGHKPVMSQSRCAQPGTTVAACRCKHPTESSSQHLTASSQGCLQ